jgi:hypothetical protein
MVTPSSTLETLGPFAGQLVFTDNNEIVTVGIEEGTTIKLGQFVTFDTEGNCILATDTVGSRFDGYGIACYNPNSPISSQTATIVVGGGVGDASSFVQVAVGATHVYTLATGNIKFQAAVGVTSGSYAVAQTEPVSPTITDSASIAAAILVAEKAFSRMVGRYFGHPKEEKTPTAAVSSDIIAVRLGV